jgi:hypothetical protein
MARALQASLISLHGRLHNLRKHAITSRQAIIMRAAVFLGTQEAVVGWDALDSKLQTEHADVVNAYADLVNVRYTLLAARLHSA